METYVIAEVGQNHNGSMELAKKLIDIAAMPIFDFFSGQMLPGVQAVKFTKRDLAEELTEEAANQTYDSPHSFGPTYLEHRQALELSIEQHAELEKYAHSQGLDFIETLCSPGCLRLLEHVSVDAIKIASRDVTNVPLLEAVGKLSSRVIVSAGMCTLTELRDAISALSRSPKEIWVLHCISEYPAQYENINLQRIQYLQKELPDHRIGYSDHSIGIVVPAAAVAMGASVIEKHITLSRDMKGSDHAGATEPDGLWRVVRDMRNVERAIGKDGGQLCPDVLPFREKLARSLALQTPLKKGQVLAEEHLCMRSPGSGLAWDDRKELLGQTAIGDMPANSLIVSANFK